MEITDRQNEALAEMMLNHAAQTIRVEGYTVLMRNETEPSKESRFVFTDDDLDRELYR